ncbi:hypothetical protein NQD34_012235 [Periophthalmus magnuspinnatus]|uniref:Transmembrane protein 200B n=1 Tax=Periophthalmus magnuspinnatus TaxID=409849 RepID=A0A3B4BAK3_9GOBI|nr:transmembrane protein 200B [Periophthalmus magnuspinnatus]KAJ0000393.1 hypothetical protein NQD34_012235 [Periophthalmus magnuspinnatus]
MTAATSPVCSPSSSKSTQSSSSSGACPASCHRHLKKGHALRTRLPLRSAPGVWLMLGVCVVLVGMCVAVAGYVSAPPKPAVGGRGSTHVERMKLAGPIVMGIGLFIFICAATLLYENRDREVKLQEKFDDLEDLKGGTGWEDSFGGQDGEQATWATPAHLLPLSQNKSGSPPPSPLPTAPQVQRNNQPVTPLLQRDSKDKEDLERGAEKGQTLLACVLYHQEPRPQTPPSPCPSVTRSSICSDSYNSMDVNYNTRTASPLPAEL